MCEENNENDFLYDEDFEYEDDWDNDIEDIEYDYTIDDDDIDIEDSEYDDTIDDDDIKDKLTILDIVKAKIEESLRKNPYINFIIGGNCKDTALASQSLYHLIKIIDNNILVRILANTGDLVQDVIDAGIPCRNVKPFKLPVLNKFDFDEVYKILGDASQSPYKEMDIILSFGAYPLSDIPEQYKKTRRHYDTIVFSIDNTLKKGAILSNGNVVFSTDIEQYPYVLQYLIYKFSEP